MENPWYLPLWTFLNTIYKLFLLLFSQAYWVFLSEVSYFDGFISPLVSFFSFTLFFFNSFISFYLCFHCCLDLPETTEKFWPMFFVQTCAMKIKVMISCFIMGVAFTTVFESITERKKHKEMFTATEVHCSSRPSTLRYDSHYCTLFYSFHYLRNTYSGVQKYETTLEIWI